MSAPAAAPAAGGHLLSLAAVIATAAIFGLTYSLSASLLALDLAERGAARSVIGLNAAMHALGVLAIAPVLPRFVGRIGARRNERHIDRRPSRARGLHRLVAALGEHGTVRKAWPIGLRGAV